MCRHEGVLILSIESRQACENGACDNRSGITSGIKLVLANRSILASNKLHAIVQNQARNRNRNRTGVTSTEATAVGYNNRSRWVCQLSVIT